MTRPSDAVRALERGDAYVDLSDWWKVSIGGSEAHGWLNDLLSVELNGLTSEGSRRSFLLTPTGRIRAAVTITPFEDGYLALQDPAQPTRLDKLLDPYVLSSDVRLLDRTDGLRLFALPGATDPVRGGVAGYRPSVLGPGADIVAEGGAVPSFGDLVEASAEDIETWRVLRGMARFGVDLTTGSLPHEVETGDAIAFGKGCFLGQEAVARVRNLGHPPFVLLAATAEGPVASGDLILGEGREAGVVTSAAAGPSGTAVIARVRWALKDSALGTESGIELRPGGLASAA